MMAVSCAKGTLSVLTAPPEDKAHELPLQLSPAPDPLKYTVFGVLNVMPLHSPRLPIRVPLMGADVPLT